MRIHCIKASNNKSTPMPSPWRSLDGFIWRLTEEREKRREARGRRREARGRRRSALGGTRRLPFKRFRRGQREEKIPGRVFAKFQLSFMYSPRTALLPWNYTGLLYSYSTSNNIIILVILLRARITYSSSNII